MHMQLKAPFHQFILQACKRRRLMKNKDKEYLVRISQHSFLYVIDLTSPKIIVIYYMQYIISLRQVS